MTNKSKNTDIDKAEDGSIILDAVPEGPALKNEAVSQPVDSITAVFATDFYRASGIAHCSLCGEKRRTNQSGLFCPTSQRECPLL